MSKQIPELTIVPTPTAGQESIIETVVARHDNAATSRMTLAQIFTLGSISGAIKSALDTLSGLIAGNTSSINSLSTNKLDKVGALRTWLTIDKAIRVNHTGDEEYFSWTTTQVVWFDSNGMPIPVTPTVDINWLAEKQSPVSDDTIVIYDSQSSSNKKLSLANVYGWKMTAFWSITKWDIIYVSPQSKIASANEQSELWINWPNQLLSSPISVIHRKLTDTNFITLACWNVTWAPNNWHIYSVVWTNTTNSYSYSDNKLLLGLSTSQTLRSTKTTFIDSTRFLLLRYTRLDTWVYHYLDMSVCTLSAWVLSNGSAFNVYTSALNGTAVSTYTASMCDTNIFMLFSTTTANNVWIYSISWSTITAWSAITSTESYNDSCFVSTNKVLATSGSVARLFTYNGVSLVQWNSLSLGATYSNYRLIDIWSSKSLFIWDTGGSTQAFIIDASWSTPTKWTTYTIATWVHTTTDVCVSSNMAMTIIWWTLVYKLYINGNVITSYTERTLSTAIWWETACICREWFMYWRSVNTAQIQQYFTKPITPFTKIGVSDWTYSDAQTANFISSWPVYWLSWLQTWESYSKSWITIWTNTSATSIYVN